MRIIWWISILEVSFFLSYGMAYLNFIDHDIKILCHGSFSYKIIKNITSFCKITVNFFHFFFQRLFLQTFWTLISWPQLKTLMLWSMKSNMPRHKKKKEEIVRRKIHPYFSFRLKLVYISRNMLYFLYFILNIATYCILLKATVLSYHVKTTSHIIGSSQSVDINCFRIPYPLPYCIWIERRGIYSL